MSGPAVCCVTTMRSHSVTVKSCSLVIVLAGSLAAKQKAAGGTSSNRLSADTKFGAPGRI